MNNDLHLLRIHLEARSGCEAFQPSEACKETAGRREAAKFINPGTRGTSGVPSTRAALFVGARTLAGFLSFVAYLSSFLAVTRLP